MREVPLEQVSTHECVLTLFAMLPTRGYPVLWWDNVRCTNNPSADFLSNDSPPDHASKGDSLTVSLLTYLSFALSKSSAQQAMLSKRLLDLRVTDTADNRIGF